MSCQVFLALLNRGFPFFCCANPYMKVFSGKVLSLKRQVIAAYNACAIRLPLSAGNQTLASWHR